MHKRVLRGFVSFAGSFYFKISLFFFLIIKLTFFYFLCELKAFSISNSLKLVNHAFARQ